MPMATGMSEMVTMPASHPMSESGAIGRIARAKQAPVSPTAAANHLSCSRSVAVPRR